MNSNSHTETNGNTPDKKLNHVHDPVCGMTVVPDASTAHAEHAGMKYYFCSQGCCDKFVAEPSRYTVGQKAETQPAVVKDNKTIYTCPMHPEVKQPGPGACPKCGMALEPMGVPAAAS